MDPDSLRLILEEFDYLMNARSIEYFVTSSSEHSCDLLNPNFQSCTLEDIVDLVSSEDPQGLPERLIVLKRRLKRLEYRRKCVESPGELWREWTGELSNGTKSSFPVISSANGLIRKRIKAKKQHEIDRIVELISQIQTFHLENSKGLVDSLVDIGAGVGHLSRMISLNNGLSVMAVEGNHQFTLAANSLDEKILSENGPTRFTSFVTEDLSMKVDEFAENATILVGLHCCGDFSSTILKVFRKSEKAKYLVLCGCCYHKEFQSFCFLHPDKKSPPTVNCTVFPLSKKWAGFELSYLQREIACHNNERLAERFRKENLDISRYARAHLEKWIWQVSEEEENRNMGLCSVKCVENETTFEEYIRKAMAKRGSHLLDKVLGKIPSETLALCVSSLPRSLFDHTDVFRLMFAPSIESAILDDRVEFLRENGITARIVPLFDATISPRNLAIVAYKD